MGIRADISRPLAPDVGRAAETRPSLDPRCLLNSPPVPPKALTPCRPAAGHLGALSVIALLRSTHTDCPTYLTLRNSFFLLML